MKSSSSRHVLPQLVIIVLLSGAVVPSAPARAQAEQPTFVGLPGTHQSELGCAADWQPDCEQTALVFDAEDQVWQATFLIQPGNDQDKKGPRYKAALNKSWGENYGLNAQANGPDIPLVVTQPAEVKFYYDHQSHWIADNFNHQIVTAIGDFQAHLGCAQNDDPGCLRSWLQDPDGDGTYVFSTSSLPAGNYQVRIAINESLDEVYGGGGARDGAPIAFNVPRDGQEMYFGYDAQARSLLVSAEGAPRGDLRKAQAYWVARDTIAWRSGEPKNGETFALFYSPDGGLLIEPGKISGGESIPLQFARATQSSEIRARFPHLGALPALKISPDDLAEVPDILRGQAAVVSFNPAGKLVNATSLQIPGVLDDLYAYDGPLGVDFAGGVPALSLWAPTARAVNLLLFDASTGPAGQTLPLNFDPSTGVWSVTGAADWAGKYYLYEVEVYVPATGTVEKNQVSDPYSISLSTNGLRSQIVDLNSAELLPAGWGALAKPPLAAPEDSVIYELHLRDFSAGDPGVPDELRGTYLAFTLEDSFGLRHLRSLAEAGLTHIHLLPAFDIATVDEDRSRWQTVPAAELAALPGDSDQQAALLQPFRDLDGFNWGYDPFHYSVPEGSYATDPDGPARVLEFRQMVQALNQAGLRVVMDVVYNHTNASGQSAKSVLDKVVPGYYHRLNADGQVERSTCCENTATEHNMMRKLMIDSVVLWARAYKVDGFRFDLMGHHMLDDMLAVRQALDALTVERDGVDGRAILVYGEGWNFGEVANNARGRNATQLNLAGSGIGSFSDRLRDGARGGGPFDPVQEQGFLTGLFTAPNAYQPGRPSIQKYKLLQYMDWIRLGLAGNLKDFPLVDARGNAVTGERVDYKGAPAGYTLDPQEQIVYISAHDNETLFDAIQYKAPLTATAAERTRMNNLGLSLVLLSQGIPFFHAGDDLLRSKSLDGNSYNSGDWYNRLDFTYQGNNWAAGLPDFRQDQWDLMRALFAEPSLAVGPPDIQFAHAHFLEMLRLRKSSPLFRLQTGALVRERLSFLDTAENRVPGLIVMALDDSVGGDLDPNFEKIVVAFNALPGPVSFSDASLQGLDLSLHPLQAGSVDAVVKQAGFDPAGGTLMVPGRTAAVFVLTQTAPEPTATPLPSPTSPPTAPAPPLPTSQPVETSVPSFPTSPATAAAAPAAVEPGGSGLLPALGLAAAILLGGLLLWRRRRARDS